MTYVLGSAASLGLWVHRVARSALLGALWMVAIATMAASAAVAQTGAAKDFDHARTGYRLDGAHERARCESCHINGVFRGTPKDCASCHTSGGLFSRGNVTKSPNHVPTLASCDACHNTRTFSGARFSHVGVAAGTCMSCHNGSTAPGKPTSHMPTTASCDSCHRSSSWLPAAGFDHVGVQAGTCATCHNGTRAKGRGAAHVPNVAVSAIGNASCDTCHRSGFTSFLPARLHANVSVSNQCATCHTGSFPPAVGKPSNALHANATTCETCHKSTTTWAGSKVDHGTFTIATNCASCHNGSAATGKPAVHVPTGTANCGSCHNKSPQGWKPTTWNHSQVPVTSQCASCHNGAFPPADGRHPSHIPYVSIAGVGSASCDSCHKAGYAAWTPARFHGSYTVTTQCASCHTGTFAPAVGRPNNATHVGATVCETCHKSTTAWATVTFAHTPANAVGTGTCDTCHNGSAARGKSANHIPVTTGPTKCDSCHRSQASFQTSVTMNHAVVSATSCKTCHSGAYVAQRARAKPSNHIPDATQLVNGAAMDCNACHKSTVAFATSVAMNHNSSMGNGSGWCKGCHQSGTAFLGGMERKSLTHERSSPLPTDCSMSGCHRPLGNKGATYTKWD